MSMGSHQKTIGDTQTWLTPPHVTDALGAFDLDPCAAPEPRPWDTARVHITLPKDGQRAHGGIGGFYRSNLMDGSVHPDFSDMPVRFSLLKAYGWSALHGYHARLFELKQTQAMQRGTATHALLFETRKVVGYPGKVRRGKEYDAFVEAHPDTEILTMKDYDSARFLADAIREHPMASQILDGVRESTMRFDWNGMKCRTTPDVRGVDFLNDVKTTANGDPVKFLWHALRMKYHAQLRMQAIGCVQSGYKAPEFHYLTVAEASAPWVVTVFEIQPRALEQGEKLLMQWSERLKTCEASGVWPGYSQAVVPLDIPEDLKLTFDNDDEAADESGPDVTILMAG